MLLIGSQALKYYTKLDREPQDWDFIGTIEEVEDFIKARKDKVLTAYPSNEGKKMIVKLKDELPIEFEIAWPESTAEKLNQIIDTVELIVSANKMGHCREMLMVLGEWVELPSLNILYELKMSHRFLKNSPHFLKTMKDIHLMRSLGARIEHEEWLKEREKETYNYSHPKLNVAKDDFFKKDEGVVYVYDHDTIHIAMARFDKPAYEYFKPANSQVLCDKKMFNEAPEEIKLASVIEEATVLALERSQIPYKGFVEPLWSFKMALFKVCTSITSGWWRSWAWEHYNEALALYDDLYVEKFWKAVDAGIVKKLA